MKLKKFITILVLITILTIHFSWISLIIPSDTFAIETTTPTVATKYFYNQLSDDAKVFYNAMDQMFFENDYSKLKEELEKQDSKFGVNSYELTSEFEREENASLKAKLEAYTKGNQDLLNTMGAARDAYSADHAGIFYIDFDNLSLRVTQDAQRKLHVFLGIGRSETYINKAFWDYENKKVDKTKLINALDTVSNELNKIVEEVKDVKVEENQNETEQQIKKAHDIIIKNNSYKLEETIIEENKKIDQEDKKGDPWNVRTVYGAFGPKHEIVCEGFARSFKMILDELNIPCVLVYGAYVTSTKYEEHAWNYVLLDDKWYGVDVTWDNTDQMEEVTSIQGNQFEERISSEYFLAGEDKMSLNHLVTGIMSVANYEFKYPDIEDSSDKYTLASENAGLRVEIDDESYDEEDQIKAAKFKISYFIDLNENGIEDNGERMGFKAARDHGYYMVGSFMSYFVPNYDYHDKPANAADEGWGYSGYFGYVDEIYGSLKDIVDEETGNSYLSFYNSNCNFIQFGITTDKPEDNPTLPNGKPNPKKYQYFGTSADMIALSDKVYNPSGNHVAAPYIKKATPIQNSTMIIGDSYHCVIEYDEKLVRVDWEDLGYEVKIEKSSNTGSNNYSLDHFKFNEDSNTVEFDFKPSELYADDSVYYIIDVKGLVGETSQKRPMPISYFCAHKCSAYAYKSQGIDWNVYGKPTLMDDVNLDEMTDEENADLSELLKHRMTLVTTTTKPSEEKAMTDFLNDPEAVDSTTGEKLNVGGTVEKTETYNIKLTLCKMQKIQNGQSVRIMLGFPDGYGPEDAGVTFKAYHYIKDAHGNITGVEEIPCMVTELGLVIECSSFSPFTIAAVKGDSEEVTSRTVLFQTSEGGDVYDEYLGEGNKDNKKSNKLVFDDKNKEAKITIVPKDGYVVDDIVIGEQVIDVNGSDVEKVSSNSSNEITYTIKYDDLKMQNYEAIVAKVAFIPEITKQAEKEAGYEVVAQPMTQSLFTISSEVTSNDKNNGPFDEGDEFEVSYKITDMQSVGEQGILGIGAMLSYNRQKLELKSITPGEGWKVDYNSADNVTSKHNIVATYKLENNDPHALASLDGNVDQLNKVVFTAKFMVLENEDVTEKVSLSHIEGSIGKEETIVKANDVITDIVIEKVKDLPIEEKLEPTPGSDCVVEDGYVKCDELNLTVKDMKTKLTSGSVLPVKLFKHSSDSDNLIELSDTEVVGTGTIVMVGESSWTVIINADLDGNGKLTINDIVLFKLDYIGEEALEGPYLMAAEMDGKTSENGATSINDLVLMLFKYNDISIDD